MIVRLLDCARAARKELAAAFDLTNDPSFDPRTILPSFIQQLQTVVNDVGRALAELSAEEREQAQSNPDYRAYLEDLARLRVLLNAWQSRLMIHRGQLDRDSQHISAARQWADAYNRTR